MTATETNLFLVGLCCFMMGILIGMNVGIEMAWRVGRGSRKEGE